MNHEKLLKIWVIHLPRLRFEDILRILHYSDDIKDYTSGKGYKIRLLIFQQDSLLLVVGKTYSNNAFRNVEGMTTTSTVPSRQNRLRQNSKKLAQTLSKCTEKEWMVLN